MYLFLTNAKGLRLPQLCESFAFHSCGLQDLHQDAEREPCSYSNPQRCLHFHMDKLLAYVFHISYLLNELLYSWIFCLSLH